MYELLIIYTNKKPNSAEYTSNMIEPIYHVLI